MNSTFITQKQQKELVKGYKALYRANTNVDVSDETLSIEVAGWLDDMMKKSLTNNKLKSTLNTLNTQILNLKDKVMDKITDDDTEDNYETGIREGKKGQWYFDPDY